ncbi:protein MMS22-like [Saccoglossus kowalevskii]
MNEINDLPYTNLSGSMTPPLSPNDIEEDAIDGPDNKRQRLEQHQHSDGSTQSEVCQLLNSSVRALLWDLVVIGSASHRNVELSQHGVCFHCQSRVTESSPWQPSSHGYLATDTLSRVLNAVDPDPSKFEDTVSQLFGFNYVTGTALMDHTKQLFYLMRQKISHYERLAENTSYLQRGMSNLISFLFNDVYYHPSKVPETNNKDCIFVTKINKFPTTLLYHISKLMTHIGSLAVLHQVSVQQYHLVTLFPCNCFKELWIQIIHLLDHRNQNMNTESFWCHLYGVIHAVIECCIPEEVTSLGLPPDAMNTSDLKGFCLWILLHISPLYQYDIHGQQSMTKVPIKCNWLAVNDILKSAISPQAGGLDEAKLRCYIKCCISLTSIWEPNTKVIVLIWDQFHKRLNEAFHVPGLGLQDFSSTKKSSASWFEDCFHRCIDSDDNYFSAFNEKGNSFKLFLKLLAVQLIKSKSSNNNQGWKQIKGRFYSKFHQRGMQQLSEVGLEHFIDLFLTLSIVVDTEDVGSRMCDLLDMLPSNRISQRKRIVIWKGLFALILINEDKLLDIKVLAHKLVLQFNAVCREFSQNSDDSNVHYKFWEIISTYLEGIQEVFERSTYLHLSEDQLIGDGFSHLLPVCKDYELHSALSCIQTILLRYRALSMRSSSNNDGPNTAVIKEQHKAIAVALWKHVYPFVKTRSTAMTPPVQLADIAANFTLLAMSMDGDSSVSSPSFLTMIQYFGLQSSQVHTSICCHYLCSILTNQTIVTTLQNSVGTDYHKQVIHAWFRCALLTPNPTEHMQELTT